MKVLMINIETKTTTTYIHTNELVTGVFCKIIASVNNDGRINWPSFYCPNCGDKLEPAFTSKEAETKHINDWSNDNE